MKKVELLFDIRDLALTVFICCGIFFPTSYLHHEELLIRTFGIVMTLSVITSLTLNYFCNKYKRSLRKKINIENNYITKEMYKKAI